MSRVLVGLAVALLVSAPGASAAQGVSVPVDSLPGLDHVEEASRLGRADEARELLSAWWQARGTAANRDELQRALWLRARLTVDPVQAELDYRRLVIEYPGGPFTDEALLRLAQSAHASGDDDDAQRRLDTLARDFPTSAVQRRAREWREVAGPARTASSNGPTGREEMGGAASRSTPSSGAAPPSVGAPGSPRAGSSPSPSTDERAYAIQLGAFASEDRARTLAASVREMGFEPRLVRMSGSRLLHVRIGRFDSVEDASDLLRALGTRGLAAVVVRDANLEEPVGE